MKVSVSLILVVVMTFGSSWACRAEEYPLRQKYPDVPVLGLKEIKAGYDDGSMILVDTRSRMEFDAIHPKRALHLDLANKNFINTLQEMAQNNQGKKIVLYDNGITCLKCYIGAQDALDEGIPEVYAFDEGIPAWADAYPADTLLMGKEIDDPAGQLIPLTEFKNISLNFGAFQQKVKESKYPQVIDARDPMQRVKKLPGFEDALPIPLDKLIRNIIEKGI